jgi:uncharacterized protein (TIGR02466 family)
MEIVDAFATPIMVANLGFEVEQKHLAAVESFEFIDNKWNLQSIDKKTVLDHVEFMPIKNRIFSLAKDYYKNILGAPDSVMPVINTSWLNVSNEGDSHDLHFHTNSLVSGVVYLRVNDEDAIVFRNLEFPFIEFAPESHNKYNRPSYVHHPQEGDVLLFHSKMLHQVPPTKGDKTRVTLAFNTFPVGTWGCSGFANEITVKP